MFVVIRSICKRIVDAVDIGVGVIVININWLINNWLLRKSVNSLNSEFCHHGNF